LKLNAKYQIVAAARNQARSREKARMNERVGIMWRTCS